MTVEVLYNEITGSREDGHLYKISERVVNMSSFWQEEAASRTDVVKEEQLLVLN